MIWNTESKNILQKYITKYQFDNSLPNFFILTWPRNIWKTTFIKELSEQILWKYFFNDFLYIEDLSEILQKEHIIKVWLPSEKSKQYIEKNKKWEKYLDRWTREINERLQSSAIWWTKILFIENIERMNSSAMNAFLKTCEESLPKRILIATSSSPDRLLETIISRAISIPFFPLSEEELINLANEHNIMKDNEDLQKKICQMSIWKPWVLIKFNNFLKDTENLEKFTDLIKNLEQKDKINVSLKILTSMEKEWVLREFIDWRIAYSTKQQITNHSRIQVKKMINSNVNTENLLLYWLIN